MEDRFDNYGDKITDTPSSEHWFENYRNKTKDEIKNENDKKKM